MGGACVVSKKKFGDYDKNDIDEIDVPDAEAEVRLVELETYVSFAMVLV